MKTTAIALLRSANKSDQAIKAQKECLLNYSKTHDINIEKFYIENGVDGWSSSRKTLNSICLDVEANVFRPSLLLVTTKNRLSRNNSTLLKTENFLNTRGVQVIAVKDKKLTTKKEINEGFAQFLLDAAKENNKRINSKMTKDKQLSVAKAGYFPGGYIPFGYKTISEKINTSHIERKKLVIHPEESKVVEKIFNMASSSTPFNANGALKISKHLNENNIYCREKPWTRNKVINVLSNTIYIGKYNWGNRRSKDGENKAPIRIGVPSFISKEVFKKINSYSFSKRKL